MRVVFVIEDSLPNGRVGPELTPTLWSLIGDGGWHPDGGVSVLASSTYPNHATFATGLDVGGHCIFTNDIWGGERFVCSADIGPVGDTLFAAARRAGRSSAAITGDRTMVGCMGAEVADIAWPEPGEAGDLARDCLGYRANSAVLEALAATDAPDADLLFVHMNDPDSTLHRYGPDASETVDAIRRVDGDLAQIVELLRPRWNDTVLFVVSDHEQETVRDDLEPIHLAGRLSDAGLRGIAHDEGSVGIVYDSPGADAIRQLRDVDGAVDFAEHGVTLTWSTAGRVFGRSMGSYVGQHGSPRTQTQVAAVSGGHERVPELARQLARGFGSVNGRPHATQYAHVIAELLSLPLGHPGAG